MPTAVQVQQDSPVVDRYANPENIPLRLPSSIPAHSWPSLTGGLIDKETRMRIAQADDALSELKKMLRITMGLWHYKHTQTGPSQQISTRTRSMIDGYRTKINRCEDRYRAARSALLVLNPNGEWIVRLRELNASDIRSPGRGEDEKATGDGYRELSWIWLVQRPEEDVGSASEAAEKEINDSKSFLNLSFIYI